VAERMGLSNTDHPSSRVIRLAIRQMKEAEIKYTTTDCEKETSKCCDEYVIDV